MIKMLFVAPVLMLFSGCGIEDLLSSFLTDAVIDTIWGVIGGLF